MNRTLAISGVIAASLALAACGDYASTETVQEAEARKSVEAAESLQFSDNTERDNIIRRRKLTANPGQIGFILLLNQAGQPIMYESVRGKITSSGKRLTPPGEVNDVDGSGYHRGSKQRPSDEGTYGSSDPYIYYWTTNGEYRQWNGSYLYSDKPFRTRVAPLVIATTEAE